MATNPAIENIINEVSITPPSPPVVVTVDQTILTAQIATNPVVVTAPAPIQIIPPPNPPMVITVGLVGPQGPQGPAGGGGGSVSEPKTNAEAFTLYGGQPVYLSGSGSFRVSQANSLSTICNGILASITGSNSTGTIIFIGLLQLADWTVATGGSPTLTVGSYYYLSQGAAGIITTIPPTGTGQINQYLGLAVEPDTLSINILQPIVC